MTEKSIMVVDDDDDIREVVGMLLQADGYTTVEAADGVDALGLLHDGKRPQMILLDLMMPRLNGADFLRQVKSEPALSDIPIVVMSGDTGARRDAVTLGAEEYLAKPVELDDLLAVAHRYAP